MSVAITEIRALERERDSDASGTLVPISTRVRTSDKSPSFYDSENFGIHLRASSFPVFRKSSASDTRSVDGRGINPLIDPERAPEEFDFPPVMYITGSKILSPIDPFLKFLPVRRRSSSAMRKKPSAAFPEEGRKQNLRILAGIPGAFERVFHRHRLLS